MNIFEPTSEELKIYEIWLETLSINEREVMKKYKVWKLYKLKSTNQKITIYSVYLNDNDEVKLTVIVSSKYNLISFERQVFGIDPEDLEECDLPTEPVGAILTEEKDINEYIEIMKRLI
jgi:hypothetical protein